MKASEGVAGYLAAMSVWTNQYVQYVCVCVSECGHKSANVRIFICASVRFCVCLASLKHESPCVSVCLCTLYKIAVECTVRTNK